MLSHSRTLAAGLLVAALAACNARSDLGGRRQLQLSDCWPHCDADGDRVGADGEAQPVCGGGAGTIDNPMLVCTESELRALAARPGVLTAYITLQSDIDFGEAAAAFLPIGTSTLPFRGVFDGGGHALIGLRVVGDAGASYIGFFAALQDAVVHDLTFVQPSIVAYGSSVGVLAGSAAGAAIARVNVMSDDLPQTAEIEIGAAAGVSDVGGLVGNATNTLVSDCTVGVTVVASSGSNGVGGIVGQMHSSALIRVQFLDWVAAAGSVSVGGIVGHGYSNPALLPSFEKALVEVKMVGAVTGSHNVGGVFGFAAGFFDVRDSYTAQTGTLGDTVVGGFGGEIASLPGFTNAYARGSTVGVTTVGSFAGNIADDDRFTAAFGSDTVAPGMLVTGAGTTSSGLQALTDAQFGDDALFRGVGWSVGGTWYRDPVAPEALSLSAHGDPCAGDAAVSHHDELGAGTATDPFRLCTVAQLRELSTLAAQPNWDKHFVLHRDLDLSGADWLPIGSEATPFAGVFDGRGHHLAGMRVSTATQDAAGFFGVLAATARVSALRFDSPQVRGAFRHAGVVAGLCYGALDRIEVNASGVADFDVESTASDAVAVGGLVGRQVGGGGQYLFANVRVAALQGSAAVGGLYGEAATAAVITTVAFRGSVRAGAGPAGGAIGRLQQSAANGVSARGRVEGNGEGVGGCVGWSAASTTWLVAAWGEVVGPQSVGGLVGVLEGGELARGLTAAETTCPSAAGGVVGRRDAFATVSDVVWSTESNPGATRGCGVGDESGMVGTTWSGFVDPATHAWWHALSRNPADFVMILGVPPRLRWESEHVVWP